MFVDYITDRIVSSFERVRQEAQAVFDPDFNDVSRNLDALVSAESEVTVENVNTVAEAFADAVHDTLEEQVRQSFSMEGPFRVQLNKRFETTFGDPTGYERRGLSVIEFSASKPANVTLRTAALVYVRQQLGERYMYRLDARRDRFFQEPLSNCVFVEFSFEEVFPTVGTGAEIRLNLFVESLIANGLSAFTEELQKALRQAGRDPLM